MTDAQKTARFFSLSGLFLAAILTAAALISGPGTRFGLWNFRTGLKILGLSAYGEIAAFVLSLTGSMIALCKGVRRVLLPALVGVAISLVVMGVMLDWRQAARHLPMIHDITTDTEDPPRFVKVKELRKDALNPVEYGGPDIAKQQRAAYPDIVPAILGLPVGQAFDRALNVARKAEWEVDNADRNAGMIEATDTTFWFGFKDDIVVRITPSGRGSRVDIRSVSRVGKSDVGKNAERIRLFLKELKKGY